MRAAPGGDLDQGHPALTMVARDVLVGSPVVSGPRRAWARVAFGVLSVPGRCVGSPAVADRMAETGLTAI